MAGTASEKIWVTCDSGSYRRYGAAIRRGTTDILSPGPYAELYAGDTVIFVGEKKAKEAVERFLNTEQKTGSGKVLNRKGAAYGSQSTSRNRPHHHRSYLISMVLIGVVVVKKVQSMDDYYLGGRSFGPLVLMATVCATIIGGSALWAGRRGYSSGFKAIMTALPYLLGMFIFSGFAGRISAVGTTFHVTSIPDLFEQRFGKTTKVILGGLIAFTMMGTVASQVTATAPSSICWAMRSEFPTRWARSSPVSCL